MGDRLKQKVAVVVGAGAIAQGIGNGKASAIVFAREGARVMAVDYRLEAAEDTKRLIEKEGGECIAFQADVSRSADCKRIIEHCIQTFGRVDILLNNVGISVKGGPVETSEEDWDSVIDVNVKSMFLTCKYALPYMEKQGSGSIINISSVDAVVVQPIPLLAYSVSKAGVNALTREVAIQYADKGIRANAIMPGLMKTPRIPVYAYKGVYGDIDELWRKRDARSPTGKQGEPWDIANAALFLASDESKYVNGQCLAVDGGLTVKAP